MKMALRSRVSLFTFLTLFCATMAISSPAQTFTTLVNFDGSDGGNPESPLVQGIDGSFYGTTHGGGTVGYGTIFKMTSSGVLTTLYSFCSQSGCTDGGQPAGGLVQSNDGNFYGTTSSGGAYPGVGTVFKITPEGALTTLYNFCSQPSCTDGAGPLSGLVQATDGNFYGTTSVGGADHNQGTLFKITASGALTTLHSFHGTDGSFPQGELMQAIDGNFYGTTEYGGANNNCASGCGTVFRMTAGGTLTTLHSFDGSDGYWPYAGLVQAADGNFYGTTVRSSSGSDCGNSGCGTVYKITPGGILTTLQIFNATDGAYPEAELVQATDGNLYGTTNGGGAQWDGTLFKITANGALTMLHTFVGTDGSFPQGGLMQSTDGNFYGTTSAGGSPGSGTIFRLSMGLSPFVETQPTYGAVGAPLTILGSNLTGATSVTFNGTPASFDVVSPTQISTTVPTGATTGTVQVTTSSGALSSNTVFQVIGPLQFVAVTPCRLVDTRQTGGPIQGGTSRSFTVPQLGGCGIPASAAAYSLNVTVVPHGPLAYLTIWPAGEIQPNVSTMNSLDGRIKANAAIVPASNNAETVYVTNTADLVLDIDGYFAQPSQSTLQFFPLTPCRVADTRSGSYPQGLGTPHLSAGVARDFPVLNSSCIPTGINAAAYSLNFTAIPYPSYGDILGFLEVWPTGEQPQHPVSTLNNLTGTYVANAAIVPAGTNGDITTYPSSNTDLAIDINGYFATTGSGGLSLYPTIPCRVIDTRKIGNGQPFIGTLTPPVDVVNSVCAPPASAQTYVFNTTVVPSGDLSYLTLWPDGQDQPTVSTLNAADGWITSNMAIVPNSNGKIDAYAAGLTQLILDISAYFAP